MVLNTKKVEAIMEIFKLFILPPLITYLHIFLQV